MERGPEERAEQEAGHRGNTGTTEQTSLCQPESMAPIATVYGMGREDQSWSSEGTSGLVPSPIRRNVRPRTLGQDPSRDTLLDGGKTGSETYVSGHRVSAYPA